MSSVTVTLRPCSLPAAVATAAKDSGYRSFGGVLTRSRARFISSARATARSTAVLAALPSALAPSSATSPSGPFPAPFFAPLPLPALASSLLYAVKAYAPSSAPSATAATASAEASGRANPAFLVPFSARAALPARRSASASYSSPSPGTGPRPTARTSGAFRPETGSLVVSPSAPVAPRVSSTVASPPSNASATASEPEAGTGPSGPLATPTTRTSARSVAASEELRVRAVTVVKSRFR